VKKQLSQQEQQGLAASLLNLPQEEAISNLNKAYAHNENSNRLPQLYTLSSLVSLSPPN